MMRDPAERLPHTIDPWAFARSRRILHGSLPLQDTQELKQWDDGSATVQFALEGRTDHKGQPRLSGTLQTQLTLQCQRCLSPMVWPLEHRFDYVLLRSAAQEDAVEDGSETLICAEDHLNLAWFLEEEVLLAMPMIAKHEDCTPPARAETPATAEEKSSPFAGLKQLINTKEQP